MSGGPIAYLDNNATTMPAPEVVEAMLPFFTEKWGNPSSMHLFGGEVMRYVDEARARVAAFIGATPEEIIFTSCATESDNAAIFGAAGALGPETTLVTSKVEHPAVLGPLRHLAKTRGHRLVEIGVDGGGNLDMSAYAEALAQPGPKAVFIMWANNETGVIFDMPEIARMAKEAGAFIHTDAVQAAGKIPLDVSKMPVDTLAFAGHKIHAPKGVGVLYARRGTRLAPYMIGGHQERGKRGGTAPCGRAGDGAAARQARTGNSGHMPRGKRQWRPGEEGSEHHQHQLRVHRRRGADLPPFRQGHLRLVRFGLLIRLVGALACDQGDGSPVHQGARVAALQPKPLHHRSRDRPRSCGNAGNRRTPPLPLPLRSLRTCGWQ